MKGLFIKGLWQQNPAIVQMLGLCPLLGVSNSLVNGVTLAFTTALVMIIGLCAVSLCRHWITPSLRLPSFMLILGTVTTTVELGLQALSYPLYSTIGLFVPLIITNCLLLARAESLASKQHVATTLKDSLSMSIGFGLVLILMGGIREWLGQAFVLMLLPPGAFIVLASLAALHKASTLKPNRRQIPTQTIE